MPKWSAFIRNLGTAGPATLQGIYDLGFALRSEFPPLLAKFLRVDEAQAFDGTEKQQGRDNLGLGTMATQAANAVAITGGSVTGITDIAVADGGTGASTPAAARTNLEAVGYVAQTLTAPQATQARANISAIGLSDKNIFTKMQVWAKGADVASAAALVLGDDGNYFNVTGTTTISSIGTVGVGAWVRLHFNNALTLTNSANLVLPRSVNVMVPAGTDLDFVEFASGQWRCVSFIAEPIIHVRDQKASGTQGGAAVSGTQQRTLNTVVTNEISGASLTANDVTLPAGVYEIDASAPALLVNQHKLILTNAASVLILAGSSEYSGGIAQTSSRIRGRFTLATPTAVRLMHNTATVRATDGLGTATSNAGVPEIYTEAIFRKVG